LRLPWLALAVGLITTPSFAEEKTALVVVREAGAETCPDAVQLGAHVNAIVEREVIGAGPGQDSAWIEVTMHKEGEGYSATVRSYGSSVGQRELSDAGPGCTALGEAVAVSLALMWTSQADGPPLPEPPEAVETESAAPPAPEAATPPPTAKPTPAAKRRPPPPSQRSREGSWLRIGVDGFLGVAIAVLEHPVPNAELGVRVDLGKRASFGIVAGGAGPDRIELDEGNVDLSLLYGAVRACVGVVDERPRVLFCLRPALGKLRGTGTDFDESWQRDHVQPSIGAGLEVRGPIARALGWAAELIASTPLERQGFSVADAEGERTVFTSPSIGLWALVGISWEAYR